MTTNSNGYVTASGYTTFGPADRIAADSRLFWQAYPYQDPYSHFLYYKMELGKKQPKWTVEIFEEI